MRQVLFQWSAAFCFCCFSSSCPGVLLRFLGLSFVFFYDVLFMRFSVRPHVVLLYFFFASPPFGFFVLESGVLVASAYDILGSYVEAWLQMMIRMFYREFVLRRG